MKRFMSGVILIVLSVSPLLSADLFTPLEIRKAYENGTRSRTGAPGPNYWTNRSEYSINVKVYPHTNLLKGSEDIVYYNESPDTLHKLVLRVYYDFFKAGSNRDFAINSEAINDGVRIRSVVLEGRELDPDAAGSPVKRSGTNMLIYLEDPLEPGTHIRLSVSWELYIPGVTRIRTGVYDDGSAFVGYWYPQMAVYDDISGWDEYNYQGEKEFYNDISDFEVRIEMPGNYLVWATGILQNPGDVLTETVLSRYRAANESDSVVHIITAEDYEQKTATLPEKWLTWHYKADHIPDFAFAYSDHHLWDGSRVKVNGRKDAVFVDAAYRPESSDFYDVADIAAATVRFLSEQIPGYPFPYPAVTVFNGSGGMEYPMMVNDGSTGSYASTVYLTSHEIAHTYFPFFMGTNERKFAWMDEGWAVMLPFDLQTELAPEDKSNPIYRTVRRYLARGAGSEAEVPPMVQSTQARGSSYRLASYLRPALAYKELRTYLGDETFRRVMRVYIDRWNGRHPVPHDFFYTFNEASGEELNWFWEPWFFEFGYPDLALTGTEKVGGELRITVEKAGNIPTAVCLVIHYSDGTSERHLETAGVWKERNRRFIHTVPFRDGIDSITLGDEGIPDVYPKNNVISFNG